MAKRARARPNPQDRVLDAALALAAERPWRKITLEEIGRAGKADHATIAADFPTKLAVLTALLRRFDRAALDGRSAGSKTESVRDQLFEMIMGRFDALKPHRAALRSIGCDLMRDPATALCFGAEFARSMTAMLAAAGAQTRGPMGVLVAKGLLVVYLTAFWTFMTDATDDLAKTMASLDRALGRAESIAAVVPTG